MFEPVLLESVLRHSSNGTLGYVMRRIQSAGLGNVVWIVASLIDPGNFIDIPPLQREDLTLPRCRKPTEQEIAKGADPAWRIDDGVPLLRVDRAITQLDSGEQRVKGPKSDAGHRKVALPAAILPDIRAHLATEGFTEPGPTGRLFLWAEEGHAEATKFQPDLETIARASQGEPATAPA